MTAPAVFDPILVTGGAGFVGACAVHELLRRGHEVHVLLRPQSNLWRLSPVLERLHIHRGDLTDETGVRDVVRRVAPRAVLHLATHGACESQSDGRAILRTNVLGTWNLLEASAEAGVAAFISAGSSSEYGFKSEPMRETDLLEPNSFYAVGKAAQSHLCGLMARRSSMGVAVFRLFSVYGPWEEPTRLIPTLLRRARAGLPLHMTAPRTVRDFVFVEDVLEALLNLPAAARLHGEVINLGTGVETTLDEVVRTVLDLLGTRSEVCWGAMTARHWDSTRWAADATRARDLLNWQPRHTLRQGLDRTAAWLAASGEYHGLSEPRAAG
jgi:nucleoside-diphosphate-sugar epimerase